METSRLVARDLARIRPFLSKHHERAKDESEPRQPRMNTIQPQGEKRKQSPGRFCQLRLPGDPPLGVPVMSEQRGPVEEEERWSERWMFPFW